MFCKKGVLQNVITLAQMLSCEFCDFFKKTYFVEHLWTAASTFTTNFLFKLLEVISFD